MPDDTAPTGPHRDERPAEPAPDRPVGPGGPVAGPDRAPADGTDVPTPEELDRVAEPGTMRRAPRYRAFVVTGALLGLVVAAVVVLVGPAGGELGRGPVLVFVGLTLALVGGLGGALVAALADRATRRRD